MEVKLQSTCSQKIKKDYYNSGKLHLEKTTCLKFNFNWGTIRLEDSSESGAFLMIPASLNKFTKEEMNEEIERLMDMGTFVKTVEE